MRPLDVEQLLKDLRADNATSNVDKTYRSKMKITVNGKDSMEFDHEEAALLLNSPDVVEELFEALDHPDHVAVELHGLEVSEEVLERLEELSETVDDI